jgi:hypothetical protein
VNIFVLSLDPAEAARDHCDRHVNKMILETAQLLSTAHRSLAGDTLSEELSANLYRPTHANHPCAVWVRESAYNYQWAFTLLESLIEEYAHRYGNESGKVHATSRLLPFLRHTPIGLAGEFTPFRLAMPDECKVGDAVESYREYYRTHKAGFATWKNRPVPVWF